MQEYVIVQIFLDHRINFISILLCVYKKNKRKLIKTYYFTFCNNIRGSYFWIRLLLRSGKLGLVRKVWVHLGCLLIINSFYLDTDEIKYLVS